MAHKLHKKQSQLQRRVQRQKRLRAEKRAIKLAIEQAKHAQQTAKLIRASKRAAKKPKPRVYKTDKQLTAETIQREHLSPRKKAGQAKIIKVHSKEFAQLQAKWYAVIAKDTSHADGAFADIEWTDNPDSPHIKRPGTRARKLVPGKQLYYALARNFATHGTFKSKTAEKAWSMHADGISYRRILKQVKKSPWKYKRSLYSFFYFIDDIRRECMLFNSTHPEGLLYGQDSFANDTLIADFSLDSAIDADTDAYDLPMDAGWMHANLPPKR